FACGTAVTLGSLKLRPVLALQAEHRARVLRRRHLVAELLDQAPRLAHLLGVAFCELAATDEQAVFETHAHVAAHHHRLGGERHLETPGAEHRPRIVVANSLSAVRFMKRRFSTSAPMPPRMPKISCRKIGGLNQPLSTQWARL